MAMGRRAEAVQGELWIARDSVRRAPGHPFYERLNEILSQAGFDRFCESSCEKFYAQVGRPSVVPGVYFRMLFVGYFEKLDSEREIAWRCDDSRALRAFLGFALDEGTPDHSNVSRTRGRIDRETHQAVFDWVLKRLAEQDLLKGRTLGIDASTLEADAAMRSIVRRDTGETYQEFIRGLAKTSGIETPTAAELANFDRRRKDKTVGNDDWHNPNDPEAKIAKMKDGRTHLAYKNEHAVDLETGAIVGVEIHEANQGDTTTVMGTLEKACASLQEVRQDESVRAALQAQGRDAQSLQVRETVKDKGYHSSETLVNLEEVDIRGYIAEPDRGRRDWTAPRPRGMSDAEYAEAQAAKQRERDAVYRNRRRIRGARSKRLHRRRGELLERSFEHVLDDGGMRRVWLKGCENIAKRYLIHVAAFNLGLILRKLTGFGTPRGWADGLRAFGARHMALVWTCWKRISHRLEQRSASQPNCYPKLAA
jgi:transposase